MSNRKEARRDAIVNTAFQLFLDKGYMNTKIIDIADAVGIGKGTFYEYFPSKESLLLEVLDSKVIADYKYVDSIALLDIDCRQKLKVFLEFQKSCIAKYGSNAFDLHQQLAKGDPDVSAEVIKSMHTVSTLLHSCVHSIISEGIDTKQFKAVNPTLATNSIVGAISSYITVKLRYMMKNPSLEESSLKEIDTWDDDELLELIFNGLNINS